MRVCMKGAEHLSAAARYIQEDKSVKGGVHICSGTTQQVCLLNAPQPAASSEPVRKHILCSPGIFPIPLHTACHGACIMLSLLDLPLGWAAASNA